MNQSPVLNAANKTHQLTRKKFWNNGRKEALLGWLFITPEFLGILIFGVFPLFFTLFLSFCEWDLVGGIGSIHFIGLDNFERLFQDDKFYKSLYNNILFTAVTVPVGMFIALIIAVVIQSKVFLKSYFKVAFFVPYICTSVAIAAVWGALMHPSLGPINQFLTSIGIVDPPAWLADTKYAIVAIMMIATWQHLGYKVIIYLAGLTNISEEIYESANIDGASGTQQFFKITLPLLGPTTFFLTITMIISSFKIFDIIMFLTEGGPNYASSVLVYYIYEEGFQYFRMGYAASISWVLFMILAVITAITWTVQKRKIHY